jgi:hypothetical protein
MAEPEREVDKLQRLIDEKIKTTRQVEREKWIKATEDAAQAKELPIHPERKTLLQEGDILRQISGASQKHVALPEKQKTSYQLARANLALQPQNIASPQDSLSHPEGQERFNEPFIPQPRRRISFEMQEPHRDQLNESPKHVTKKVSLESKDYTTLLDRESSDRVLPRLADSRAFEHATDVDDQIQINEQIERDMTSYPKPSLYSGLKPSKRKRPSNTINL